ncbi:MAG: YkgJ family cysteine cluster protein [Opitutae bacterium]|nr:YkgJ family cysteine cluster protein [Opitutae bacterium]
MSSGFSAKEEALFFQTGKVVFQQLRDAGSPADLLPVLRRAQAGFERAFASAPATARRSVACRAGCGACCHERVGVQAHEVLLAAEFIQANFAPEAVAAVIARAANHRAAYERRAHWEAGAVPTPCVVLHEGSCTIYAARPESCRAHHSHNAEACARNLAAGEDVVDVYIRGVRGRMFAVMLGIDHAAVEAGFDGHAYDFGSALHEALTNSLCLARWQQRQPAFPASCREEPDADDPDAGEMRPSGFFTEL